MKVQLHRYPAIVMEKGDKMLTLVYCATSGRIVDVKSCTVLESQFLHKKMEPTKQRLLEKGWKIKERDENVHM